MKWTLHTFAFSQLMLVCGIAIQVQNDCQKHNIQVEFPTFFFTQNTVRAGVGAG